MITEIEIGKIYADVDGSIFREVIAIRGDIVAYWFADRIEELKNARHVADMLKKHFIETNEEYREPLTFKRIREERIKSIKFKGVIYNPIGFSFGGNLICLMPGGLCEWKESEIKDWEIVKGCQEIPER